VDKSRSSEQIFADMHRQLRAWDNQIPESPERLDPIVRILLQLYSDQLSRIDRRLDVTWDVATGSLIKSLSPESKRWPVPAYTVMRCLPVDPEVEVDPHTRFFYKEKREGGQTFFFSSLQNEKLFSARAKHIFLRLEDSIIDLSPVAEGEKSPAAVAPPTIPSSGLGQVFVAIDYSGQPTALSGAVLFLKATSPVQKQLRWARWYPGSRVGSFHEDCGFCPGLAGGIDQILGSGEQERDWGGLRTNADLLKPLEDSFMVLPESFAVTWEMSPPAEELSVILSRSGIDAGALSSSLYWMRLDLPPGGDRSTLQSPFDIRFDCFIAVNKNELKLFKHTGGSRLVEIELPEPISTILEITSVVDSDGREYAGMHRIQRDRSQRYYSLEERNERLVLWFDFSSTVELPPDSISVTYSITAGVAANAIAAGKIVELYENHPGIESVENVVPTAGAIPAKTDQQVITEASARLRSRDRALTFPEIVNWALTFDPRIKDATCENGVERAGRGVRRCIIVMVRVNGEEFHSDDETAILQTRLRSFLKSRSPVNTQFKIEVVSQ